jgi:YVTN family beta-propeller protein
MSSLLALTRLARIPFCVLFTALALATNAATPNWSFYVTNEGSGDLSIIDGTTLKLTGTVPLGKRPRGLRSAPDGRHIYIALSGSPVAPPGTDESKLPPPDRAADGIGVFDTGTRTLERVLRGVTDPEQLAISADGKRVYVASEDAGKAIVLDTQQGARIAELDVGGEPEGTALSPNGRSIYMTSEADHRVSVIDTRTNRVVARIEVGLRPRAIAFSHDGRRAYVSGEADGSITVIDTDRHAALQTFHFDNKTARPMSIVVAPDDRHIFVTTGRGGTVARIDLGPMQIDREVSVGPRPWGLAISPDGRVLATANGPSNDVTLIDADKVAVIEKIAVGTGPWGVAVQGNTERAKK